MNMLLKRKRDIDESNLETEQTSNVESCYIKKVKSRPTRKYDESYLSFGFFGPEMFIIRCQYV